MAKKLFLIHGRSFKPAQCPLKLLWLEALRHGLQRDHQLGNDLDKLSKEFVYFGDLSNTFLAHRRQDYDEGTDLRRRKKTLNALKKYPTAKAFNRSTYRRNSPLSRGVSEALLDAFATPAHWLGLADDLASLRAPDLVHYWNEETEFGSNVRWRLAEPLAAAFKNREDIILIGHSLGTLIAYDVLWKFSYLGEYQYLRGDNPHKLSHFVTLGSPLGNPTVQEHLKGGRLKGARRYPTNIGTWSNVAAEDDYVCHDETIADEFQGMNGTVIKDYPIYNLAVKDGKAHQHHGTGYLIHPVVAKLVQVWMEL